MQLQNLEKPFQEEEKDFLIFHLKKRIIISLEIKSKYTEQNLNVVIKQANGFWELFSKWCGGGITDESCWRFFSLIYFDELPGKEENDRKRKTAMSFCEQCSKCIIIGNEFEKKFTNFIKGIPDPPNGTKVKAKEEFKRNVSSLLFIASAEPVITPRRITSKVVEMVDRAGN